MDKYQRFLTEYELANYFKVSVHKLRRDRVENRGVPYIKYGRQVRYPVEIIEQFLEDNKVIPKN
jgi:predicted DNA-binding transcriptional regulator YafY